jgi:pilus assembly protein FimV
MGQSNRQKSKNLMMKALSPLVFSACVLPAMALDLGRLQILSAIGEPLQAEIEVTQASTDELRTLRAQLAPPGAFAQAGMEFNPALNGVKASLQTRPNGALFIVLNGRVPIQENFIDLILETQSSSGKLIKNYALLMTSVSERVASANTPPPPPTNNRVLALPVISQEPAPINPLVTPFRTNETANPLNATSVELNDKQIPVYRFAPVDNAQAPTTNARANESNRPPASNLKAPAVQASPKVMGQTSLNGNKTVKVRTGDTASRLALQFLGPNVSLDQMMLAMLEANPDAFIQGNVNMVKAGAVLRIPEAEEATQIPRAEARKTVMAQSIEFAEYARHLAESPFLVDSKKSRVMSGKVTTESGKTETTAPQQDKLTLSKSSVASTAAETKIARDREAKDTSDQLAALNKNLKDLEALAKNSSVPNNLTTSMTTSSAAATPTPDAGMSEKMSQLTSLSGTNLKDLTENKQLWAWAAAFLAALFFVAFWIRKNSAKPESIYAPSYDDVPNPGMGPVMGEGSSQVSIPDQLRSIDLNLQAQANDAPLASQLINPAPLQAAAPVPQPTADETDQSKLNLAAQLLAKGDNDLARALILSVVSSTHGDIKARAIQMLGQIK